MPPFLSICIPTYQRAARLQRTLGRLVEVLEAGGWTARAEVCISDNASEDDTPAVIAAFRPPGLTVHAVRQPANGGFARNLHATARLATGEYLLFLGDDDALASGTCATLERALAERPAIGLFPTVADQPLDGNWRARAAAGWLTDAPTVARVLGLFHLTFIGNFVARRTDYVAHVDERCHDSLYPHVIVLLRILARERARWCPEPLFVFDEPARSWNLPLLTAVDLARVYADELLAPTGDPELTRAIYGRTVRSIPRALLNRRTGRPDEPANRHRSLALGNLLDVYRCSSRHQVTATLYWLAGTVLPASLLRAILGHAPRKVEFPAG